MQRHTRKGLYFSSTGEDNLLVRANNHVNSPAHEWDAEHRVSLICLLLRDDMFWLPSLPASNVLMLSSRLVFFLWFSCWLCFLAMSNTSDRDQTSFEEKKQLINKQSLLTLAKRSAMSKNPDVQQIYGALKIPHSPGNIFHRGCKLFINIMDPSS